MPQMNPMNWVMLLMMFSFSFYLTMIKLHFIYKDLILKEKTCLGKLNMFLIKL